MTRDELISILHTKKFTCIGDMARYFHSCGFGSEITNVNWDDISVVFTYKNLEFTTVYDPWWGSWVAFVPYENDDSGDSEEILLHNYFD